MDQESERLVSAADRADVARVLQPLGPRRGHREFSPRRDGGRKSRVRARPASPPGRRPAGRDASFAVSAGPAAAKSFGMSAFGRHAAEGREVSAPAAFTASDAARSWRATGHGGPAPERRCAALAMLRAMAAKTMACRGSSARQYRWPGRPWGWKRARWR